MKMPSRLISQLTERLNVAFPAACFGFSWAGLSLHISMSWLSRHILEGVGTPMSNLREAGGVGVEDAIGSPILAG